MTLDLPQHILTRLSETCDVTRVRVSCPADLVTAIPGYNVLLCTSFDKVNAELLDAGMDVRAVVTVSAGYNHVDTAELSKRGIMLSNTPDVLTDSVAEVRNRENFEIVCLFSSFSR